MRQQISFALAALSFVVGAINAQTPMPIVVPAVTSSAATTTTAAAPANPGADSAEASLKLLQEIKAANDETLRKQEATLLQLDELEKAADQLKVFSKRG